MSHLGTVKSWSDEKGFGFIIPQEGGNDVFVHRKVIGMQSSLIPHKEVRYDLEIEDGKPKATLVHGDGVVKKNVGGHMGGGGGAQFGGGGGFHKQAMPGQLQVGIVKIWAQPKGYGFISQGADGSGPDLFVLNTQTRGNLIPGAKVTYSVGTNPKTQKPWAENVVMLDNMQPYDNFAMGGMGGMGMWGA
eukprot:TRINITY_DN155_c0_g2_i1.p2 TRINITY_DN155_c0_g2~~TRINITY_DN155_c0_g2_i1.p2  ORF type:complete len:189 (+),score=56.33 TRINITY_DN155_c0_g2_i1:87-653(+)